MAGDVQVHMRLWKMGAKHHATAVLKATFAITDDGQLVSTPTEPIRRRDATEGERPTASVSHAREDMPLLPRVDVVLRAHGYPSQTRNQGRVRLMVTRGDRALIDKTALLFGDRATPDAEPWPFDSLLLGYERALGGIGFKSNPLGTGAGSMTTKLPNIVHPERPNTEAIGFGPLSESWPSRKALRGTFSFKALKEEIADLPADVNWLCLQVAPEDQQLDELLAGDAVSIEGVRPEGGVLRFEVPAKQARAELVSAGAAGSGTNIALRLDSMAIDATESKVTFLWRGYTRLASGVAADSVGVRAGFGDLMTANAAAAARTSDTEEEGDHERTIAFSDSIARSAPEGVPSEPEETWDLTIDSSKFTLDAELAAVPFASGAEDGEMGDERRIRQSGTPFVKQTRSSVVPRTTKTAAAYVDDEERFSGTVTMGHVEQAAELSTLPFTDQELERELKLAEAERAEEAAKAAEAQKAEELARKEAEEEQLRLKQQALEEADKRRQQEAENFKRAQQEAKEEEIQRQRQKDERRRQAGQGFRSASYGGLGRRKRRG